MFGPSFKTITRNWTLPQAKEPDHDGPRKPHTFESYIILDGSIVIQAVQAMTKFQTISSNWRLFWCGPLPPSP